MSRAAIGVPEGTSPEEALLIGKAHPPQRLSGIDLLRGLVIVIMALDHVRDYFTNVRFDPLDPAHTNALLWYANLKARRHDWWLYYL